MKYRILFPTLILAIIIQFRTADAVKRARTVLVAPAAPPGKPVPSSEYAEPGCGVRKAVKDLNTDFINKAPAWFIPLAHNHFYYSWAEALINRSMVPSELSTMCMKWLFLSPTKPRGKYNIVVGGLTQAVSQLCMDTGFETETCESPVTSPEHHKNADNVGTIIATDNVRWFLLYRCVRNKIKDWAVFLNDRKPLDSDTVRKIAVEVKNHGFDLKFVGNGKYDKCP